MIKLEDVDLTDFDFGKYLNDIKTKCIVWLEDREYYHLNYERQYEPWDNSGTLELLEMGDEEYDDYKNTKTIGDFLEEYNGQKRPSYMSGHGWFYENYINDFADELDQKLYDYCLEKYKIVRDDDNWDDELFDDLCWKVSDYAHEFFENISDITFKSMYGEMYDSVSREYDEYTKHLESIHELKKAELSLMHKVLSQIRKDFNCDNIDKPLYNANKDNFKKIIIDNLHDAGIDTARALFLNRFSHILGCSNTVSWIIINIIKAYIKDNYSDMIGAWDKVKNERLIRNEKFHV
jgi:hypothetical protein